MAGLQFELSPYSTLETLEEVVMLLGLVGIPCTPAMVAGAVDYIVFGMTDPPHLHHWRYAITVPDSQGDYNKGWKAARDWEVDHVRNA